MARPDTILDSAPRNARGLRSYADWRAGVPFTDAEVIAALEQDAEHQPNDYMRQKRLRDANYLRRTGRLSSGILGLALPYLVRICSVCGKVALYRYGSHGRCKTHKWDAPADVRRAFKERDAMAGERGAMFDREDRIRDAAKKHHQACGLNTGNRGRRKP